MRLIFIVILSCVIFVVSQRKYSINKIAKLNWFAAFQDCQSRGQQLLTINSEQEEKEIEHLLKESHIMNTPFWTSGTDQAEEGNFVWMSTGKPFTYSKWREGEPNNVNQSEHCMHIMILAEGTHWNDNRCHALMYYICEDKHQNGNVQEFVLSIQ